MRTFRFLTAALLLMTALAGTSCQKVIDVNLNDNDPKIVIEGLFTAGENSHVVTITRTLNFDESEPYPVIDNAIVSVTDNLGNSLVLTYAGNGKYVAEPYAVVEGRTYTLTVNVDGEVFTAASTVPTAVVIDTLLVNSLQFGPDTFNALVPARLDPAGERNFYMFNMYKNGVRISGYQLQDDEFTDGQYNIQPLFVSENFATGDTGRVEMFCLDEPVYNYFYALSQNQMTTPANPTSNFTGDCFGYFSARTKSVKSGVVP